MGSVDNTASCSSTLAIATVGSLIKQDRSLTTRKVAAIEKVFVGQMRVCPKKTAFS